MKKIRNNYNVIRVKGLNFTSFLNLCVANDISIHSIQKHDGFAEFGLNDRDLRSLRKLNLDKYDWQVVKVGGLKRLLNIFIYRIGLCVGLILSIVFVSLLNNRLLRIHVSGLSFTDESEVVESIHEFGIDTFSSLNFDKASLEDYLGKKFHFSLVSVISKGNSLIINVKEKLPSIEDSYVAITADYNMIIDSIEVHAGTAKVKSGDIVFKGDTLVEPFVTRGEEILYIKPIATIHAKIYFSSSYKFIAEEKMQIRTGKYSLISSDVYLGKYKLWGSQKSCTFENFEIDSGVKNVSQYFLPISMKKSYAYELKEEIVTRDFEEEKDKIVDNVKTDAYNQVPNYMKVDGEDIVVTSIEGGYVVGVYLNCNYIFEYN